MADSPLRIMEELFDPLKPLLDHLFLVGVVYGSWNTLKCCCCVLKTLRNYLLPVGRAAVTTERLGEWAGVLLVIFARAVYMRNSPCSCHWSYY